ncbi:2-hydroxyacid dehydrogenase [Acidisoma cellulosilytica]|uniref:2-hydroxyacid dehydrogenase n=1 Tax=Acidisoma cellulosilyticum TaxID=2802395 RepID=A0A963Z6F3_9PROT|nr:2-hydroxyacid dehydrogenase [Acidisoma cellulosilyticum]MCB8883431.1 2-hydroxyacid dehydrogenase [Acidisoma cellulosilyticum]
MTQPSDVGDMRPEILMMTALPQWDMEPLDAAYRIHRYWEARDKQALLADCKLVRAILTTGHIGADAALLSALPAVEMVACFGVGVDGVDFQATRARGLPVTNTPDVLTGDVADLAIGLALAVMREIPKADTHVRSGTWKSSELPLARRFFGCKLGIVGMGRIGIATAERAKGFGCDIGYFNRTAKPSLPYQAFDTVQALAGWADVVIVTLAGGAGTRAIMDRTAIQALGPQGFLVNVSRGSTVDEAALIEALQTGGIAGAGLDVFLNEPNIDPRFANLSNTVLMPHMGSATTETRQAMGQLVRDNLAAHFAGQPLLTPVE